MASKTCEVENNHYDSQNNNKCNSRHTYIILVSSVIAIMKVNINDMIASMPKIMQIHQKWVLYHSRRADHEKRMVSITEIINMFSKALAMIKGWGSSPTASFDLTTIENKA